jgi:ferredoxin
MPHVIIDTCTKDAQCVDVCPSEAIGPKKEDANFPDVTQLFINPAACLDCGACAAVCPTNSIFAAEELPEGKEEFVRKNAEAFPE